jgi:XTP/dITP diphosphohydrolase
MITLLLATRNAHKVAEIQAILGQSFGCLSLKDFPNPPEVIEDAATFAGNATKKAVVITDWISKSSITPTRNPVPSFVLADDSGLEVDALQGAPGVYSARYAGLDSGTAGNSSDADNRNKLLHLLRQVPPEKRTARFRCVLALTPTMNESPQSASPVCYANEKELGTELYEGVCEGSIAAAPCGNAGFGYDPLFIPVGYQTTFAEMSAETKNHLSHRARALAELKRRLVQMDSP